jgi:transcriptional regulator with XRE-family HTH domain
VSESPRISWVIQRLKAARKASGKRLDDVGAIMGVAKAFLSNLEHERREPTLSTVIAYADALEIPMSLLFDGCPDSDGTRTFPSARKLTSFLRDIGLRGVEMRRWHLLTRTSWVPDEGKLWQLADEIVWCSMLVENGTDIEQAKRWIETQIYDRYDNWIGQMKILEDAEED